MSSILARSSRWLERCRRLLSPFTGVQVVSAGFASGIHQVVADLRIPGSQVVWLKLDEEDAGDSNSVANKLSRAVERSVGGPVFGLGLPVEHGVAKLARLHDLLGPYTIVVSRAHFSVAAVSSICSLAEIGASILLIVPESLKRSVMRPCNPSRWIEESEFKLRDEEVKGLTEGHMPEDEALRLAEECGYLYVEFVERMCRHVGLPPLLSPEPDGFSFQGDALSHSDPEIVLRALIRRGAQMEAFELAARELPSRTADLVDDVGPRYALEGLNARLKSVLERLPRQLLEGSDSLMRWWFSSATNMNEHRALRPTVERYLRENEAPELRALYAAAFPGSSLLVETRRAVEACETVATLRMYGFALTHLGRGDQGVQVLMRALTMAEAYGDIDQIMAIATDICNSLTKRGLYGDALQWAEWALEQHYLASCRDESRRLSVMGLLVFVQILTDQQVGTEQMVRELAATDHYLGVPGAEAVTSTVGDWHAASGEWGTAVERYRLYLDSVGTGQYPFVAPDLAVALVRVGRHDEAGRIGSRARSVSRGLGELAAAMGTLAYGLALHEVNPTEAEVALVSAIPVLKANSELYRLAQAAIAVASMRLRVEDVVGAREVLVAAEAGLSELGRSGWRLLAGSEVEAATLWALFNQEDPSIEIRLLGDRTVIRGGLVHGVTARCAECLALIASRPEGLPGEQLAVAVQGEGAVMDNLRSSMSRLRHLVPLESRPYRISAPYRADFLDLLEHLRQGQLRQALSLYKGQLLRESDAPGVVELREHLEESLRQAVLLSGDGEAMLELARRTNEEDLELLERAYELISRNDPQSPLLRARIRRIRREWMDEGRA